jgi:hypothetical protein
VTSEDFVNLLPSVSGLRERLNGSSKPVQVYCENLRSTRAECQSKLATVEGHRELIAKANDIGELFAKAKEEQRASGALQNKTAFNMGNDHYADDTNSRLDRMAQTLDAKIDRSHETLLQQAGELKLSLLQQTGELKTLKEDCVKVIMKKLDLLLKKLEVDSIGLERRPS